MVPIIQSGHYYLMARLPRLVIPHQPHYVIQRGNDRQIIFRDADDHIVFLNWLREGARQFKVAIHAYALLPDEVHLLATPSDEKGLSRMMQWIGRYYVPYFNRKYQRAGTLWQGRYKATVIEPEKYFMTCSRYIELSPMRAGAVTNLADYSWSSYGHHIGLKPDPIITDHSLYWALGNTPFDREAAYKILLERILAAEEVTLINEATIKGRVLGTENFLLVLEKKTVCRVRPAKKGRPLKQKTPLPVN